jgi:hypothetical protein
MVVHYVNITVGKLGEELWYGPCSAERPGIACVDLVESWSVATKEKY